MKLFIVMNYTAMEEKVIADRKVMAETGNSLPYCHASSRAQHHDFVDTGGKAPQIFFSYKTEAETHLKYLITKYPHLAWGIFTLSTTQQADVPVKTTKV